MSLKPVLHTNDIKGKKKVKVISSNGKYDINPELFFQLDEGCQRGHDQKLFKKRFGLDVRNKKLC